jgi:hypothetical protein
LRALLAVSDESHLLPAVVRCADGPHPGFDGDVSSVHPRCAHDVADAGEALGAGRRRAGAEVLLDDPDRRGELPATSGRDPPAVEVAAVGVPDVDDGRTVDGALDMDRTLQVAARTVGDRRTGRSRCYEGHAQNGRRDGTRDSYCTRHEVSPILSNCIHGRGDMKPMIL